MKKLLICMLALALLAGCAPASVQEPEDGKLHIVATVFPAYDFARAAAGDLADVELLLPPGTESHSYEPTPADILKVQSCDLFLYLGGDSDQWVETILEAAEPTGRTLALIDCVETLEEEHVEGMQEEVGHHHDEDEDDHDHDHLGTVTEIDEHVWTAPANAAAITRRFGEVLAELDSANGERYRANAEKYAEEIDTLDGEFHAFFDSLPDRTIVFGDRFPLRYFAEEFDLRYYAAFPGCSTQTEPSAATIAFLTDKVREEGISTVWYIEFSNHLVADAIAEAAGAGTAMFHSCHNVSPEELALIEQKMSQIGTRNREAYLRKMALDGYVVQLDLPELKELVSLLRRSSNNLNQLTRRVHETGRVYDADLEDIAQRQEQLWEGVREILTQLSNLS